MQIHKYDNCFCSKTLLPKKTSDTKKNNKILSKIIKPTSKFSM